MSDRHRETFLEEAHELLAELEVSLLALEESPQDPELIGRVFRAMHTIKGSGAMFGFDDVASFTHEVETVFDLVRRGEVPVSRELIDATLKARDRIRTLLDAPEGAEDDGRSAGIIALFRKLVPERPGAGAPPEAAPPSGSAGRKAEGDEEMLWTYRIRFRPPQDIFLRGMNPLLLLSELAEMGEVRVAVLSDEVPLLEDLSPEMCHLAWDVILTTGKREDAIRDVFIFIEDGIALTIDVIDESGVQLTDRDYKKLGEILMERGDIDPQKLRQALGKQKRLGELLVDAGIVTPGKVRSALAEQRAIKEQREKRQAAEAAGTVRVPADRLDALMNLVGELVTVQARFSQTAAERNDPQLTGIAEEVERLSWELRDNAMNIRMLPIGTTFSKFKRLVRDLSSELGKEIDLGTEGAETELDKNVIDKLNDPLVHLIRNSIDHGIEPPDAREAAGKSRRGTIRLSAAHSGAHVLIRISDDGAGLDKEAIREKATERGLIPAGASLDDKDLYNLVLLPGFSTARRITNVSGRGVGMDVVKQAIEGLRGTIDISSARGAGTDITIQLPLTLAIIDGLLVSIGEDHFVLPLSAVSECVELSWEETVDAHGRNIANVRGQIIPYIRLRDRFSIGGERPLIEHIVIADLEGARVGFVVDRVVGEHQTVIKSLGRVYRNVRGVSGATILGDGTVALILDIPRIARDVEREESVRECC